MDSSILSDILKNLQTPEQQHNLRIMHGYDDNMMARAAQQDAYLRQAQVEREQMASRKALAEALSSTPETYDHDVFLRLATTSPEAAMRYRRGFMESQTSQPAAVREFEFFQGLSPEDQAAYMGVKRSAPTLNLGGTQAVLTPEGDISRQYEVTPKPEQMPSFKAEQQRAQVTAKQQAEKESLLQSNLSKLPELYGTVSKLDALANTATHTIGGRVVDSAIRELGLEPTQGAIARKEYESIINNQILPLLRDTFGAQFTEREGEALKATLGDVDSSPAEKQAVLRSFIEQKIASIQSLQRELGKDVDTSLQAPEIGVQGDWRSLPREELMKKFGITEEDLR